MSNYINQVSDSLKNYISELANNPCLFLRNPNVDFSRKRKIDFKTFIGIMMNSGGATMSKELLDFFDFNKNTPSVSAFTQQRSKVLPEAFEYLFKSFTDDNLPTTNNYHGYENYNIFAHAIEKGWKFAIRVKDKNSNGIASGLNLPPNDEFDIDITQIFSRKNTKTTKNAGYKWMPANQVFDYLPRKSDKTKQVNFTIAIYICREYLRNKRNLSPPDVINLIEKHVLPVRPGRKDPRKIKPQASVSFLYRVA